MLRNPELIAAIQSGVGSSLWQCQALEDTLIHYMLVGTKVERDAAQTVIDDIFQKYGELTLGQLAAEVKNLPDVPSELQEKLRLVKIERNWLVHQSWSDTLPHANSASPVELTKYLNRIRSLGQDALEVNKLFSKILHERVKKAGVSEEYLRDKTAEIYSRWLAG